jgi:hypothetical protein
MRHPFATPASVTSRAAAPTPMKPPASPASGTSLWTARVAARSKIRSGRLAELAVDATNLQFFDPGSGLAVAPGSVT